MDSLIISGGRKLHGEIKLSSAKNAVLPIIACCIMSKEEIVLKNCPKISDVQNMLCIINSIGGRAYFRGEDIVVNCKDINSINVDESLTKSIRSSVFILGSIISRFKEAKISYPGGCKIGKRPIDLHISGLRALGVKIVEADGIIACDGANICGGEVDLAFPSVGATENVMMAATLTKGRTVINNAAKEPEIVDLANFINYIGGKIRGQGSSRIEIEGVEELTGGEYSPIADRIVAGTILAGCATCGGKVKVENINEELLESVLDVFIDCGCKLECGENYIQLESNGNLKMPKRIETNPFPDFPTDMQSQIMSMLVCASGEGIIVENLFENRFAHAKELIKMGADIEIRGKEAKIKGVNKIYGSIVRASDLRGGAALIIAGLKAEGTTIINEISHIDRGYENIEKIFNDLGAKITKNTGYKG